MCPAFFARVSPVVRSANPACMKSTKAPAISSHVKLIAIFSWPIKAASPPGSSLAHLAASSSVAGA